MRVNFCSVKKMWNTKNTRSYFLNALRKIYEITIMIENDENNILEKGVFISYFKQAGIYFCEYRKIA